MINKKQLMEWIKEEIYAYESKGEIERGNVMYELLEKLERGNFDKKEEKFKEIKKKKNNNQFANLTEEDVKKMNEASKRNRTLSNITFEEIYGEKTKEKVEELWMYLKVYDDGKDKYQSFRAWCDEYPEIDSAYGDTFDEACENYYENVKQFMLKVISFNEQVRSYRCIKVDWTGKPI